MPMPEVNPHDPTNYNEWYWKHQNFLDDGIQLAYGYIATSHIAGRFWSEGETADLDTLDDYPVYFVFRGIAIDIFDAVMHVCDHCNEIYVSGGYHEPEDRGCDHDFGTGPCKFAGVARHIEKMLLCPPGTYELEGW